MTDEPRRTSPARALFLYLVFVFLGGALIAPWIYYGLQALAPHSAIAADLASKPFRALVNRSVYLLALIGMWPLIRSLRIKSWREIGWWLKPKLGRDLLFGFLSGTTLLVLAAGAAILAGAAVVDSQSLSAAVLKAPGITLTAIFVALLEETFFRGAIFFVLQRALNTMKALWLTSAIYAIFHFFARPISPTDIDWDSGFIILGKMLSGFIDPKLVLPGFLSLTLLGAIFNLSYLRTGALYFPIGIHAAAIFWSKLYAVVVDVPAGANRWFWGSEKITDGWLCFFVLLAAAIFSWRTKPAA